MKPLLAEKVDIEKLRFPVIASPKIDGFRCLIHPTAGPVTRSIKPIKNHYIRGKLQEMNIRHFDGELVTYTGNKVDDFNTVQSKLTTHGGMPEFRYYVFDHFQNPKLPFRERLSLLNNHVLAIKPVLKGPATRLESLRQILVETPEQLAELEKRFVDEENWEGVMIRDPDGVYKYGRSTVNEGILLKLKRFEDSEGTIAGVKELMHNGNEATTSNIGYAERSSHKANMVPMDTLGALIVNWRGVTFDLGTGFDAGTRKKLWELYKTYSGNVLDKLVTFKFQGVGPNGKPRFPVFLGLRGDLG